MLVVLLLLSTTLLWRQLVRWEGTDFCDQRKPLKISNPKQQAAASTCCCLLVYAVSQHLLDRSPFLRERFSPTANGSADRGLEEVCTKKVRRWACIRSVALGLPVGCSWSGLLTEASAWRFCGGFDPIEAACSSTLDPVTQIFDNTVFKLKNRTKPWIWSTTI